MTVMSANIVRTHKHVMHGWKSQEMGCHDFYSYASNAIAMLSNTVSFHICPVEDYKGLVQDWQGEAVS